MLAPIQKSNYQLYKPPPMRLTKSDRTRRLSNSLRSYSECESGLNRSRTLSERSTKSTASLLDIIGLRKRSPESKRNRTVSTPAANSRSPSPRAVKPAVTGKRNVSPVSPSRKRICSPDDRPLSVTWSTANQLGRSHSLPASQRRRSSTLPLSETPEMDEIRDFDIPDHIDEIVIGSPTELTPPGVLRDSSNNSASESQPEHTGRNSPSPDVPETGDLKLFRRRSDSNELRRLLAVKKLEQFRQEAGLADLEVMPALRKLSQEQSNGSPTNDKHQLMKQRSWSMGDVPQLRQKRSLFRRFLQRIRNAVSSSD